MTKAINPSIKHAQLSDFGTILSIYMENSNPSEQDIQTGHLSQEGLNRKRKQSKLLNDMILNGTQFLLAEDQGYIALQQSENTVDIVQLQGTNEAKRLLVNAAINEAREDRKIKTIAIADPQDTDVALFNDFGFKASNAHGALSRQTLTP